MLVAREQFDTVYGMLKEAAAQCAGSACSIIIFVAADCDAACACRTLTTLLKTDNIQHKVRSSPESTNEIVALQVQPVSGYGDISEASTGFEVEDVRSIIMLNCGASIDLESLLLERTQRANVFVVDYHRPVHLKNVHSQRVLVLDAEASMDDVPSDGDDVSSDDDDDDDEEEEEEEEEIEGKGEEDELVGEEESGDAGGSSPKRARQGQRPHEDAEREAQRLKRRRLRAYYDGNYDGIPSSLLLFSMCDALSRATTTELWLAAVGLSSMHDHWRLANEHYDAFVGFLAQHLRQMGSSSSRDRQHRAHRHRVDGRGSSELDVSRDAGARSDGGLIDTGRVSFEPDEPRFMLHRHWGLLWSMYYSNYVASRLSVWRRDGTSKLYELLAKIGLSIEQSQQRWSFLAPSQRRKLRENLPIYAPEYKLDEPFRAAFLRVTGSGGEAVSANDAAACVESLLEASLARIAFDDEDDGEHEEDAAETDPDAARQAREKAAWLSGFWRAYDVALAEDGDLFATAVESAIALQKAVVSVAVQMIDKKEITTLKHFRYVYLNASQSSNQLFTQPLALRKLALFLLGVHRHNGKWTGDKARPLVILAERPGTWLVIGVQPKHVRKNRFGHSFRYAAEHIKASFRHDWFDAAVIEVSQSDVQRFVESLHYILSC